MAWSYRKRVKIAPGVNLNLSKKGPSVSVGPKGLKMNVSKRGVYQNTSIPGTGLYSRKKVANKGCSVFLAAFVILVVSSLLLISCKQTPKSESKKTYSDFRREALASKERVDTIFGSLCFGQNINQVYESLDMVAYRPLDKYYFDIKGLDRRGFSVDPQFFNDSLFSISFRLFDTDVLYSKSFIDVFIIKYGQPDIVEKEEGKSNRYYWYKNNLEIYISENLSKYMDVLTVSYDNILVNRFGEDIVNQGNYYYTKDYYKKNVNTSGF